MHVLLRPIVSAVPSSSWQVERDLLLLRTDQARRWRAKRRRLLWARRLGVRRGPPKRRLDGGPRAYYLRGVSGARIWRWLLRGAPLRN